MFPFFAFNSTAFTLRKTLLATFQIKTDLRPFTKNGLGAPGHVSDLYEFLAIPSTVISHSGSFLPC